MLRDMQRPTLIRLVHADAVVEDGADVMAVAVREVVSVVA
jgi:hypothetical protein